MHQQDYDSRHLWQVVKPLVHQIAQADGVLIFDDNVAEKPYMATNAPTGTPERADSLCIQTQYARGWKVEEFHQSIKSNTG